MPLTKEKIKLYKQYEIIIVLLMLADFFVKI